MAKMGKFTITGMKELQKQLNKIQDDRAEAFIESCAKELAARLLAKVIKRTPVGDYSKEIQVVAKRDSKRHKKGETYTKKVNPSGQVGGTLRRGWTSRTHEEAAAGTGKKRLSVEEAAAYVDSLTIVHTGNTFRIEIVNPVEHAPYVEYGHRTASHKGWVPGHFMLTISEKELQSIAPRVLENNIKKFLEECMK